ncbi:MAG: DUF3313 family protein [Woeseiaceae bacterium]|jgi:hypothetical protein|nr:DUF3313 family protein [Woeseiaceae bacterium]
MNKDKPSLAGRLLLPLSCALLLVALQPVALAQNDELPDVSADGLHLLKNTKSRIAYAKPGATLDKYTKVLVLDCFVQFREKWQKDYNLTEVGLNGRVSDKDAEAIKKRLAEEFRKEFTKVLGDKGYAVVDEVGDDVLLVRPAIINLDVTAPDLRSAGWGTTVIQSAGSMTLYLELYDSATSELLARVIDAKADRRGMAQRASRVTNAAAADRIIREWASELADHLGDVKKQAGSD